MPLSDHLRKPGRAASRDEPSGMRIFTWATALVALLVGGTATYFWASRNAVQTDPESLCALNKPPSAIDVILLDTSTGLKEAQQLRLKQDLTRWLDSVPRLGLVAIYEIDRVGGRVVKPVVALCSPGSGAEMNKVYQNPQLAQRRWESFRHALDGKLDTLLVAHSTSTSPILESIQATALRTFGRPEYDGVARRRMLIISDLVQNVPDKLNQYRDSPAFSDFRQGAYFSEIDADLTGVEVSVLYLLRPTSHVQGPRHLSFWESYFASQGAAIADWRSIPGD